MKKTILCALLLCGALTGCAKKQPTLSEFCSNIDGYVTVINEEGGLCFKGDARIIANDNLDNIVLSYENGVIITAMKH